MKIDLLGPRLLRLHRPRHQHGERALPPRRRRLRPAQAARRSLASEGENGDRFQQARRCSVPPFSPPCPGGAGRALRPGLPEEHSRPDGRADRPGHGEYGEPQAVDPGGRASTRARRGGGTRERKYGPHADPAEPPAAFLGPGFRTGVRTPRGPGGRATLPGFEAPGGPLLRAPRTHALRRRRARPKPAAEDRARRRRRSRVRAARVRDIHPVQHLLRSPAGRGARRRGRAREPSHARGAPGGAARRPG